MLIRIVSILALLSVSILLAGEISGDLRSNEQTIAGGNAMADGKSISGPSFYVRHGEPIVSSAQFATANGKRQFAYVLVVKGDPDRKFLSDLVGNSEAKDGSLRSHGSIRIVNNSALFDYQVTLNANNPPSKESLKLNADDLDLAKGRVVLIDLSGKQATVKQAKVSLPENPIMPIEAKDVEKQAKELLSHLSKQSAEVREFLK